MSKRLLVIQVAGLGYDFFVRHNGGEEWQGLRFRPAESVFPAVTCTVQASFRTAAPPSAHGMVFNGVYLRDLRRPAFWEQSSALVEGPRIWDGLRAAGRRVGLLFWQQSLGEDVDVLLSPAPVHKHGGGMVEAVHSRPAGLYDELVRRIGKRFKLMSYWGPLASAAATRWIAAATREVLSMPDLAPDLLLTYLPHLDYDLQRYGPSSGKAGHAFSELMSHLGPLVEAARKHGYEIVLFGDYAFADATRPLFPNQLLREKGFLQTRKVGKRHYPDFHYSRAFAVVDHEIAHVYVRDASDVAPVAGAMDGMDGVDEILTGRELAARGLGHPRSGQVVLVAEAGAWFAYPWWRERAEAPDYAAHIDIHNKPGYDPCELFFGWPPFTVSTNAARIKGSHGRVGPGRQVAWTATLPIEPAPRDLIGLARAVASVIRNP